MKSAPGQRMPVVGAFLLLATIAVASRTVAGFYSVFSERASHDDEGYFLHTLAEFLKGDALYDQIPTIYGPFYYVCQWVYHGVLNVPVAHQTLRVQTCLVWVLVAALLACAVGRAARSSALGVLFHCLAFPVLSCLAKEPGHPQALATLILAGCLFLVAVTPLPGKRGALCAGLGFAAGTLLGTKINVGVFALAALSLWLLALSGPWRGRRTLYLCAATLACALPVLLMRAHLALVWGMAAIVSLSLLSAVWIGARVRRPPLFRLSDAAVAGAAAALGMALPALLLMAHGTTPSRLVSTLGSRTASFPSAFRLLPYFGDGALFWVFLAAVAAAAALWWGWQASAGAPAAAAAVGEDRRAARAEMAVSLLRLAIGLDGLALLLSGEMDALVWLTLPWLWMLLLPAPAGRDERATAFRAAVCFTAILGVLQGYPVWGTQAKTASVFVLPAVALLLRDGWVGTRDRFALPAWPAAAALSIALLLAAVTGVGTARRDIARYRTLTPLALPGSGWMRLPEAQVAAFRFLSVNLHDGFDTFISEPGVSSLYLWARVQPPTVLTRSAWMLFPADSEQRKVVEALARYPRPAVVRNAALIRFWTGGRPIPRGPLLDWVAQECIPIARVRDWEVLGRRGSPPPILSGGAFVEAPPRPREMAAPDPGACRVLLRAPADALRGAVSACAVDTTQGDRVLAASEITWLGDPARRLSGPSGGLSEGFFYVRASTARRAFRSLMSEGVVVRLLDRSGVRILSLPVVQVLPPRG